MKFLIITNAPTLTKNNTFYSYAPYVKEMNIWSKYVTNVGIVSPNKYKKKLLISSFNANPTLFVIPSIAFVTAHETLKSLCLLPYILFKIYKAMQWADHIHLRCPGNIGLLGCFVQVLFPMKPKTVKFAGNWDPKSKQPWSYRLQKRILSNTFLTRNAKVLVYGNWKNQSKNIVPFFTASYSENEIENVEVRDLKGIVKRFSSSKNHQKNDLEDEWQMLKQVQHEVSDSCADKQLKQVEHDNFQDKQIDTSHNFHNDKSSRHSVLDTESHQSKLKLIFVGGLTSGKQPLLTVKVMEALQKKGYHVQLDMYGDGIERKNIENYIQKNKLEHIYIHGNSSEETVTEGYQRAHFLVFLSKSEGWPKVVAEAMFWGCLPITTNVSCISEMLNHGRRGSIVNENLEEIIAAIEVYIKNTVIYNQQANAAMQWSRNYTLEKFEKEIKSLIVH